MVSKKIQSVYKERKHFYHEIFDKFNRKRNRRIKEVEKSNQITKGFHANDNMNYREGGKCGGQLFDRCSLFQ